MDPMQSSIIAPGGPLIPEQIKVPLLQNAEKELRSYQSLSPQGVNDLDQKVTNLGNTIQSFVDVSLEAGPGLIERLKPIDLKYDNIENDFCESCVFCVFSCGISYFCHCFDSLMFQEALKKGDLETAAKFLKKGYINSLPDSFMRGLISDHAFAMIKRKWAKVSMIEKTIQFILSQERFYKEGRGIIGLDNKIYPSCTSTCIHQAIIEDDPRMIRIFTQCILEEVEENVSDKYYFKINKDIVLIHLYNRYTGIVKEWVGKTANQRAVLIQALKAEIDYRQLQANKEKKIQMQTDLLVAHPSPP